MPDKVSFLGNDSIETLRDPRGELRNRALTLVSDLRLFEQVFIDCGAVTWPGEIDLAPDAMYAEISGRRTEAELATQ